MAEYNNALKNPHIIKRLKEGVLTNTHGAGLDTSYDWKETKSGWQFQTSYHSMNDAGYYTGWYPVKVRFNADWTCKSVTCRNTGKCHGLRDELESRFFDVWPMYRHKYLTDSEVENRGEHAVVGRILCDMHDVYGANHKPAYAFSDAALLMDQLRELEVNCVLYVGVRDLGVDTHEDFLLCRTTKEYLFLYRIQKESLHGGRAVYNLAPCSGWEVGVLRTCAQAHDLSALQGYKVMLAPRSLETNLRADLNAETKTIVIENND